MRLKDLLADGRIRSHRTSAREVADLMRVVDCYLADAAVTQLSTDRRFATAYDAELPRGCLFSMGERLEIRR